MRASSRSDPDDEVVPARRRRSAAVRRDPHGGVGTVDERGAGDLAPGAQVAPAYTSTEIGALPRATRTDRTDARGGAPPVASVGAVGVSSGFTVRPMPMARTLTSSTTAPAMSAPSP